MLQSRSASQTCTSPMWFSRSVACASLSSSHASTAASSTANVGRYRRRLPRTGSPREASALDSPAVRPVRFPGPPGGQEPERVTQLLRAVSLAVCGLCSVTNGPSCGRCFPGSRRSKQAAWPFTNAEEGAPEVFALPRTLHPHMPPCVLMSSRWCTSPSRVDHDPPVRQQAPSGPNNEPAVNCPTGPLARGQGPQGDVADSPWPALPTRVLAPRADDHGWVIARCPGR